MAGYKAGGGYFTNMLGSLRTSGLVDYPQDGHVALTSAGRALAQGEIFTSVEKLHQKWLSLAKGGAQEKIIRTLIDHYPAALTREELGELTGYESAGGYFTNMLGALRTMGAVEYPSSGEVVASDLLFPEGL